MGYVDFLGLVYEPLLLLAAAAAEVFAPILTW
jgi:hypothetical protein